ncbi:hormogonium polysaccharide biosynthesis protein HpsA [Thermosynechococcaceae cyanobacterium Okahandja]
MTQHHRRFGLSKRQYRKLIRSIRHLFYQLRLWLQRRLSPLRRQQRSARWGRAGFVLPTAIIVVLVLTLTVGALMLRTLNRTSQVAGERQDIQVLNAATPAIDRAKAKLEYLFTREPRRPSGVPGEARLQELMRNEGANPDPYTLDDEQRIDINGDGDLDNAWVFQPTPDSIVAYSILMTRPNDTQINQTDAQKAATLVTRNRSLNISETAGQCASAGGVAAETAEAGWDSVGSASLRKNFQIDAFVYENRNGGQALATLEFTQERELDRGNKWGAWFRNDLEIFPGPPFRWNGAMHTEGSIFVGGGNNFTAYLVSSPRSCIYTRTASEITTAQVPDIFDFDNDGNTSEPIFQGQFIAGTLRDNNTSGITTVHSYREPPADPYTTGDSDPPGQNTQFRASRDSVVDSVSQPAQLALNPVLIVTDDRSRSRATADTSNASYRANNWTSQFYGPADTGGTGRFSNQQVSKPYVDDTYRADDRYGPRPVYANVTRDALENNPAVAAEFADRVVPDGTLIGTQIPSTNQLLLRNTVPASAEVDRRTEVGLDGYWERRARQEGLRIIVGERLELGKPLDPPAGNTANNARRNEFYQHRALRDDLAAVQATAIYHYKAAGTTVNSGIPDPFVQPYPGQDTGGYEPIACLATTHHHGTPQAALRSIMFNQYAGVTLPAGTQFFDFFTGRGTNGWEFVPPNPNSTPMQTALRNLVNYAADQSTGASGMLGAFPPRQEAGVTHPNPLSTRAGNFSNLARALDPTYGNDSLADQSTRQTAACMLGMLAHSVNTLENLSFDLGQLGPLNEAIANLDDFQKPTIPTTPPPLSNGEVYPFRDTHTSSRVEVYRQGFPGDRRLTYRGGYLDANAYITALTSNASWSARPLQETATDVNARLARLIALKEQVNYELNPSGYSCSIPNAYQHLRDAFCLGENKRGFVIGQEFPMPQPGREVTVQLEDAPSYNFDVRPSDVNRSVYIAGVGQMEIREVIRDNLTGKVLSVKLRNPNPAPAGNVSSGTVIRAGASASIMPLGATLVTGTVSAPVSFPNNPLLNTTVTLTTNIALGAGDIVEIRQPNWGQLEGRFVVQLPITPAAGPVTLRYLGGTQRSGGSGSSPIPTGSVIVRLAERSGSSSPTAPILGTFNTVIKYPALRAIFNGVTPAAIAATPRPTPSDFLIPTEAGAGVLIGGNRFPNRLNQIIDFNGNARNVAFLDNTLFNGREEMAAREMDLDLDLLRRTPIGGDTWLPMGGIVYAFREDAVREDGIARPAVSGQNWMNTDPANPHDPVLTNRGISTKPVDFFADPMRRPNGFRLWNGVRLDRQGIPADKNIAGLSFISDNPVYIQGHFNWHSTNGTTSEGNRIEEFTQKLPDNFGPTEFYDNRTTLDGRFARPDSDTWRPTEILGDAVTILSSNFCNGSANDYFAQAYNNTIQGYGNQSPENVATNYTQETADAARVNNSSNSPVYPGCLNTANLRTSFLNANRPSADLLANGVWLRESPFDPSSPIFVDRNGTPWAINHLTGERIDRNGDELKFYPSGTGGDPAPNNPYNSYYGFGDDRSRNGAADTRVNAVIISGIVPSRPTQSYGGMHNFPRFIEGWGNLWIQGSFIQLSFSTQATGPFDQDQWEVPTTAACRDVNTAFNCPADTNERIKYYGAPARRWGYDVGLQLAPAGPVASRFITPARQRSEYYTELPADDPYILRLRCANRPDGGGRVDPSVTGCPI